MFKIALKSLLGHKLRMLLTTFAVVLGVGFVAGTYIFTDGISNRFEGIISEAFGSIDVIVQPKQNDFGFGSSGGISTSVIEESVVDLVVDIDGVADVEGNLSGIAQLLDKDDELIGIPGAPALGFSWTNVPAFTPLTVKDGNGRGPEGPGEIVVDLGTATTNDIKIGDKIRVQSAGPVEEFEVVGLVSFGNSDNGLAGATLVSFELEEARRVFGIESGFSAIEVISDAGVSRDSLKQRIDQVLPDGAESITGDQQRDEGLSDIRETLGFVNTALLSFAGIAIFVGAFIIFNTFQIVVSQRSKELALLRAIGASKRQVRNIVTYEAFLVGIVASLIGLLAGIGIAKGIRSVAGAVGISLPDAPLTVEPRTVYVSLAVGIIVTVVSAVVPAIKASRVSPVEAMRDSEATAKGRSLRRRVVFGLVLSTVGAAVLLYGLFGSVASPINYVAAGAIGMFLGVTIIAPLFSFPVANIVGVFMILRYGVVGRIARQNSKRLPRRTAFTAAALMIGVSLVVFSSIFASSIKSTVDKTFAEIFPGDITITSKLLQTNPIGATFPSSVSESVEDLDEVEKVVALKYDFMKIQDSEELVVAIPPDSFNEAFTLSPSGGSYDDLRIDTIYIKDTTLTDLGLNVGDEIDVEYALSGEKNLLISGSFTEAFDSPYLISQQTYFLNFNNLRDTFAVANFKDGVALEDGKNAINKLLEDYPTLQAQDKDQLINDARTQIDQALGFLTALLGLAVIVAVLGIMNTLTLSVSERTREIGMLRAIGMTRPQVRKMIRAEAIIIAVFGALLGIVMGIFFGWAIIRALHDLGFTAFSIPVAQVLIYLLIAAFAGVIAAIVPSYKASRMNILNAINYE